MLLLLVTSSSSQLKVLYNPQAFFTHAALLDQAFAHCPIFPTAASRRSLGRVSVPVWLFPLRPATDRCLGRPLPYQLANLTRAHPIAAEAFPHGAYAVLARVSSSYPPLLGRFPRVTHPSATLLSPEGDFAFDLHVLGMPPAFNLS